MVRSGVAQPAGPLASSSPGRCAAELGVTVEQDVAVGTGKRQSLAQLLYDPVAGRMLRDVEV